jgi:hypothetical protein
MFEGLSNRIPDDLSTRNLDLSGSHVGRLDRDSEGRTRGGGIFAVFLKLRLRSKEGCPSPEQPSRSHSLDWLYSGDRTARVAHFRAS